MFHPRWREQALRALEKPFDLLVVGGGISGCGIFFDAAQRGLRVLLVEKGDLASGTSSRSSKLLHGGLRYLKQMQIGLTRHSCRERDLQVALHPHLATSMDWVYPIYRSDPTPGWKVGVGLRLYDHLSTSPQRHRRIDADELARRMPGVATDDLDRAFLYHDARVDDARLTWAVAASGFAHGGWVLTRAAAEGPLRGADGRLRGLLLRDGLTDRVHEVEAALVINATGAWVDRLRHRLGLEGTTVRPSRGSHLVFDAGRLPLEGALSVHHPEDHRPVFFIPHPEGLLVGTTDLFHHGSLDDPRPTPSEIGYLLGAVARAFPENPPGADEIRGTFAGVRPVLDNDTDDPSKASREEATWFEGGLLSVAGGKLTTWRSTAEEVVDLALRHLPEARARRASPCATAGTPLAGLAPADTAERLRAVHGLGMPPLEISAAEGMARRLGSLAWTACELGTKDELRPLREDVDLCAAEVRTHCRFGAVVHLSDLLLRRVRFGLWRPDVARELAPELGELLGAELGWSAKRWEQELEAFEPELQAWTREGVRVEGGSEGGSRA